ncbi:MAG: 50S ribosomal protein L29 [Candidatus Marinimicrobia bacterium]|nr:50S ribosomal protein L29 [Candidatus Neomarinimicrobiota bacterium]
MHEDMLALSPDDLRAQLQEKHIDLTNLRFKKALQQLEDPLAIRRTRRDIARINTLLREYDLGRRKPVAE